jgi:riboflavin transporter FmnP
VFSIVAGYIYKYHKTKRGALLGCLAGAAAMAAFSLPLNYFVVYPAYAGMWFGGDMHPIIGMYKTILPVSDTLPKSLLIFNVPFTLGKGLIDALLAMLIYKPLSKLIEKMNIAFSKNKAK